MKKLPIIGVALVIVVAGYFGLAFVLRNLDKSFSPNSNTSQSVSGSGQKTADNNLVGNWDTSCVVPDPKSPWAERHTFTINSNGTAEHKRYSGDSCAAMAGDLEDSLNFTIPSSGKINLSYTSGLAAGVTSYDIYQVSGNTLKFGHGFCNCVSADGRFGNSEGDRYASLNNFLLYKKQ